MARTYTRKRRDGWWYTIESDKTIHENGPFDTKDDARAAAKTQKRDLRRSQMAAVPPVEEGVASEAAVLRASLIAQYKPLFNRVDATDLELAAAVRELSNAGVSQTEMERLFGSRKQTWYSYMYRLSMIPDSLIKYLAAGQISTTALIKGVDKLGVITMERTIPHILDMHRRQGVLAKITEKELYDHQIGDRRRAAV